MTLPKAKPRPPAPDRPDPPDRSDWRKRLYAGTQEEQDRRKIARLERDYPRDVNTPFRKRMAQELAKKGKAAAERERLREAEADKPPRPPVTNEGSDREFAVRSTDGQGHGVEPSDDIPF